MLTSLLFFYLFSVYVSLKGRCLAPPPPDNASTSDNVPFYDALGEHDDDQNFDHLQRPSPSTVAALASALPNIYSSYEMSGQQPPSIEKYVNPLGTVTTITAGMTTEVQTDILDEVVSQLAAEDTVIHENCDEALFRPVVAIFCDEETRKRVEQEEEKRSQSELCKPPEHIPNKLIVPVIAKEVDDEMCKRAKAQQTEKTRQKLLANEKTEQTKFAELSSLNKKCKPLEDKKLNTKNVKTFKTVVDTKKKTEQQPRDKQDTEEKPIEFKRMTPLNNEKETFKGYKNNPIDQTAKTVAIKPTKVINKKSIEKETVKDEEELDLRQDQNMTQIKTENLNISDLADSLIELKVEVDEEEIAQKLEVKKEDEEVLVMKLMESVDIYAAEEKEDKDKEQQQKAIKNAFKESEENKEIKLEDPQIKTDKIASKTGNKNDNRNKKAELEKEQDMNKGLQMECEDKKYKVKVIESDLSVGKDNKQKSCEASKEKQVDAAKAEKKAIIEEDEFKVKTTETLNKKKDTQANNSPTKKQQTLSKNNSKDTTDSSKVITQQPLKKINSLPLTEDNDDKVVEEHTATTCAWKNLSGAEMINKNLEKPAEKIIDIPTPTKSNKKGKKPFVSDFEDFPMLKPLEALPPLPALEPLELLSTALEPQTVDVTIANALPNLSLINFESPSQENSNAMRKVTSPRAYTDQNLIYALCGSLHYENETADKTEMCSPTLSLTRSSSVLGEHSTAEYKSLTENDEQYISLELSSQDTHTTNTNTTTNEKLTSSSNASSASEEVVSLEEKKMSKRQKRKLLKSKKEAAAVALMKSSEQPQQELDEELRPLIDNMGSGLSDSQADSAGEQYMTTFRAPLPLPSPAPRQAVNNNTTDSEGPLPCTTSDDNVVSTCASDAIAPVICTPQKIKTKKLEHKINLIAAIEAATSSSTSSAEESGVEVIEGRRRSLELDGAALVSLATTVSAMPLLSAPIVSVPATTINTVAASGIASSGTNGGAKKKTKRRKR